MLPTRSPMPIAAPCSARRAGVERGDRVDDGEVAIAVAVPVDPDAAAALLDDLADEADDRRGAGRRRVADGVGDADARGAGADRRRVQPRSVSGSARVVSSVTYITGSPSPHRERDRLFGQLQQLIERPAFGVLPERARADERAALDRHAGPLRDLGDRLDVGDDACARRSSAVTRRRASTISRASRSTSRTTCGPAPGRPMSAVSMPSRSIRCRISSFCRSSGSAPTATAGRRAASRRRAVTGLRLASLDAVPVVDEGCMDARDGSGVRRSEIRQALIEIRGSPDP